MSPAHTMCGRGFFEVSSEEIASVSVMGFSTFRLYDLLGSVRNASPPSYTWSHFPSMDLYPPGSILTCWSPRRRDTLRHRPLSSLIFIYTPEPYRGEMRTREQILPMDIPFSKVIIIETLFCKMVGLDALLR